MNTTLQLPARKVEERFKSERDNEISDSYSDTRISAVESARFADIDSLTRLLESNVPFVAASTIRRVSHTWHTYRVVRDSRDRVIGAASLQPLNRRAEIRGLAVDRAYRCRGIATALIERLLQFAQDLQVQVVCVTRQPEFFQQFGFRETDPSWIETRPCAELQIASTSVAMELP